MLAGDYGESLEDEFSLSDFKHISPLLARLHVESTRHTKELIGAGVPCESVESLLSRARTMSDDDDIQQSLLAFEYFSSITEKGEDTLHTHVQKLFNFIKKGS